MILTKSVIGPAGAKVKVNVASAVPLAVTVRLFF